MTALTTTTPANDQVDTITRQKSELFYLLLDLGSLAKAAFNHPQFQQVFLTIQQFAEEDTFGIVVHPVEPNPIAALEAKIMTQVELEEYLSAGQVEGDWSFVTA